MYYSICIINFLDLKFLNSIRIRIIKIQNHIELNLNFYLIDFCTQIIFTSLIDRKICWNEKEIKVEIRTVNSRWKFTND